MKKLFIFFLGVTLLSSVTALKAQESQDGPVIQFEKTHHDFGVIKEEDGPQSYTYKFTNTGTKPLLLTKVQPACGCTASEYTKEEVPPGGEGYVKATYDVRNRPGKFSKSITIQTNGTPSISLLTFSGDVTPRVKTVVDSFPAESGNIRFQTEHVNFGRMTNNVKDTVMMLGVANVGTKPVTFKSFTNNPEYVSAKFPFVVKPGERTEFPIHYNATIKEKSFGLIFDQIKLVTDDEKTPEKKLSIIADVHQYFPKLTDAELAKAPKIYFPLTSHEFGDVEQGTMVSTTFEFTNKGKQDLEILEVKTTCGCTVSEPEKRLLKPGETSKLKVTYNSAGKHGKEEKYITVYSNDPSNPEAALKISANVIVPGEASN